MKKTEGVIKTFKRETPFVTIDNSIFNDKRISYKAKGILGYLISKPNGWKTKISDLYNHSVEGFSSIRSGITELVLAGYMELKNEWDEDEQKFTGRFYIIRDCPLFTKKFRKLENRNKTYIDGEELLDENPLGDRKQMKKIKDNK